ncbi:MAG: aquaporin [Bacteroidia bacterium]
MNLKIKLYLIEAWGLGTFMVSACLFATILEYPGSYIHNAISSHEIRNMIMGIMMGVTAYLILISSWGKKSGAHINPAVTIVNYRLRKISLSDSIAYIIFQTIGGTFAVYVMQLLLGHALIDKPVESAVTIPYCGHPVHAFFMELAIAFVLMLTIQIVSNSSFAKHTEKFAGFLVMMYVIIAGPVSGFGMNPARTIASALPAHNWNSFWIYAFVPIAGMLIATEFYLFSKKFLKARKKSNKYNHSTIEIYNNENIRIKN